MPIHVSIGGIKYTDYLVEVMLPLIIELLSPSLVPAEPKLALVFLVGAVYIPPDVELSVRTPPIPICIMHWDLRFMLSLSFLLLGNSPTAFPVDNLVCVVTDGGGGRGGFCTPDAPLTVAEEYLVSLA